jgi:hypothetical protein
MTDKTPPQLPEDRRESEAPAPRSEKSKVPASPNEGRLGPAADPAEGKR